MQIFYFVLGWIVVSFVIMMIGTWRDPGSAFTKSPFDRMPKSRRILHVVGGPLTPVYYVVKGMLFILKLLFLYIVKRLYAAFQRTFGNPAKSKSIFED